MVARADSVLYSRSAAPDGCQLMLRKATWRSGYATVCKTVYPGSIPGVASNKFKGLCEAFSSAAVPGQRKVSRVWLG